MSYIIFAMLLISFVFAYINGTMEALSLALSEATGDAVDFVLSVGVMICFWTGLMEVLKEAGALDMISRLLKPILSKIFPKSSKDSDTLAALSANISANMLGLGNAATPMGILAAERISKLNKNSKVASNELCMLVVINTASVQILPTTIAAIRQSYGASSAFDILPCVWISSIFSVSMGVFMGLLLSKIWRIK